MSDILGIDIGVGSIKVVVMNKNGDKYALEAIGETANKGGDWLKEGNKKSFETVVSSIKLLLSDMKLKQRLVATSLPEDEVVSRLVRLPPLKDDEIKEALRFEAETFVPFPLDKVSIDYEVVERDEAGRLMVFAIAAKNDIIQRYVSLFKTLNLNLVALESPAVAMRRTLGISVSASESVMVVDMGEKYSDIVIVHNNNVLFTRAMSVGGESLTRAISVNLGLDMASAEEYKKAYGMKEIELEGKIKAALLPVFSAMAEEIRRAMVAYREEWSRSITLLVLSGGGAHVPGLAEEMIKVLGVEVQVIQPFMNVDVSKVVVPINLPTEGCRFSIAVGLALRGMV